MLPILKPGGVMLVSVASWAWEEYAEYMGVEMFWSHFDPDKTRSLITEAGFDIEFGFDFPFVKGAADIGDVGNAIHHQHVGHGELRIAGAEHFPTTAL